MTIDTTQEAAPIAVTRDMLTEALTEFYLTVRSGPGRQKGQVADPAEVASALHATLSRIAAERAPDDEAERPCGCTNPACTGAPCGEGWR